MKPTPTRYVELEEIDYGSEWESPSTNQRARQALVSGRPARILLAEDDADMREMLAGALRADGFEVIVAESGRMLFEEIGVLLFKGEAIPADLIVSDERMPGMLGSEILSAVRRARWPTPFILITGFGDEALHRRAEELGASAVVDKPFDLDAFRQIVLTVLLSEGDPDVTHRTIRTRMSRP
jgi:DNA-binding response OmpR family regulator